MFNKTLIGESASIAVSMNLGFHGYPAPHVIAAMGSDLTHVPQMHKIGLT